MKANQLLSKQVVCKYGSVSNLTLFSHFGSHAQRLANGNTVTGQQAITSTAGRSRPSHWAVLASPASAESQRSCLDQPAAQEIPRRR